MTYEELKQLLQESKKEDWLYDDERGIFTFKKDLNITIRREYFDNSTYYTEEWANNFFKPATRLMYEIYYGASFVEYLYFISLDEGRAEVPLPTLPPDLKITKYQEAIAKIVDIGNSFENYRERAGITVGE
jgi:hypothetical protein